MPESLQTLASALADYLSDTVLDSKTLSTACILDALAGLDITLIGVGDSTHQRLTRISQELWS